MQLQRFNLTLLIILFFIPCGTLSAQEKEYYFYRHKNTYGSDLNFNPVSILINGGLDILRNGGHTKDISKLPVSKGLDNVFNNVFHPLKNIEKYGWIDFFREEIFNLGFDKNSLQYVPNYSNHVFGAGITYAKLTEWFDHHNVKHPAFYSFLVSSLYHIANEVTENGDYQGVNVDPIADILIFNPIGYLLFSNSRVKHFFGKTLQANDWNLQPIFNLHNNYLENTGQQFVIKYPLPRSERFSAFLYWGLNGIGGMSYRLDHRNSLSIGVGTYVNKLNVKKREIGRFITPNVDGAVGLFYDRDNSLMLSVLLTGPKLYNSRINIYPGILNFYGHSPGMFFGFGEWDNFVLGMSLNLMSIGFGIGNTGTLY